MKRILALAAASMMTLSTAALPALAQSVDTQAPMDTQADSGSSIQETIQEPDATGVDNMFTSGIDNTLDGGIGLITKGQGAAGIGVCPDTDQPRTPDLEACN